jgi:hypothetical protein
VLACVSIAVEDCTRIWLFTKLDHMGGHVGVAYLRLGRLEVLALMDRTFMRIQGDSGKRSGRHVAC